MLNSPCSREALLCSWGSWCSLLEPAVFRVDEASRQMGLHFSKAFASHHVPSFVQEFHTSPFQTEGVAGMCELIHLLVWGAQLEAGMPQAV